MLSKDSSQSLVSSGSMSGSCVGRPSWITEGTDPVCRFAVVSSLTCPSLHARERRGIYPAVAESAVGKASLGCHTPSTPLDYCTLQRAQPPAGARSPGDDGGAVSSTAGSDAAQPEGRDGTTVAASPASRLGF